MLMSVRMKSLPFLNLPRDCSVSCVPSCTPLSTTASRFSAKLDHMKPPPSVSRPPRCDGDEEEDGDDDDADDPAFVVTLDAPTTATAPDDVPDDDPAMPSRRSTSASLDWTSMSFSNSSRTSRLSTAVGSFTSYSADLSRPNDRKTRFAFFPVYSNTLGAPITTASSAATMTKGLGLGPRRPLSPSAKSSSHPSPPPKLPPPLPPPMLPPSPPASASTDAARRGTCA